MLKEAFAKTLCCKMSSNGDVSSNGYVSSDCYVSSDGYDCYGGDERRVPQSLYTTSVIDPLAKEMKEVRKLLGAKQAVVFVEAIRSHALRLHPGAKLTMSYVDRSCPDGDGDGDADDGQTREVDLPECFEGPLLECLEGRIPRIDSIKIYAQRREEPDFYICMGSVLSTIEYLTRDAVETMYPAMGTALCRDVRPVLAMELLKELASDYVTTSWDTMCDPYVVPSPWSGWAAMGFLAIHP